MSARKKSLSIGEVLSELKGDFPDISVSKIRFLESEGLIAPERTASGYRKFGPADLDRLRFILSLQRDSFLPLKVIRERLAAADAGAAAPAPEPAAVTTTSPSAAEGAPAPLPAAPVARAPEPADDLTQSPPLVHLTENDLAGAVGLELKDVRSLRDFGVICEHAGNGGGTYFDGDDLQVGKIAAEFLRLGIEPRHLKILRRFAEQEAAMFEQLVVPVMRNRRPDARAEAQTKLTELSRLARALRQTYVRQSLRATLTGER